MMDEFKSYVNYVVKDAVRKQEYRGFAWSVIVRWKSFS